MNKYYYEGKTKEQAIELAIADLKISEEDLIINSVEEKTGLLKKSVKIEVLNINEIISYIKETINEIINKTEYLLMFPYMGRKIPEFDNTNFRELIYKSYRILYKVNSNIYILNVFHHSRDFLNSVNIINN